MVFLKENLELNLVANLSYWLLKILKDGHTVNTLCFSPLFYSYVFNRCCFADLESITALYIMTFITHIQREVCICNNTFVAISEAFGTKQ